MPRLGAHESIGRGHDNAVWTAHRLGCDTVQLFTKNNLQWSGAPISPEQAERFRRALRETGIAPAVGHASYLINMASPHPAQRQRSAQALADEVRRSHLLGLPYLVVHPGSHMGCGEEAGLDNVVACLDEVCAECPRTSVRILLETTSGQGSQIGQRFEHMAEILSRVRAPERLGICLDTCHIFSAGYDLRTPSAASKTLCTFDEIIGMDQLYVVHLNDSKGDLGSRLDRHEHIGKGRLGIDAFRYLLRDSGIMEGQRPGLLETPKGKLGRLDMDRVNLKRLRMLVQPE